MIILEDIKSIQNMSEEDVLKPLLVAIGQGWYMLFINGRFSRSIYMKKGMI